MNRRLIAAVLLAVLTALGSVDLLEDTGLIHYFTREMDRSLEDVLDNYGEAIRLTENILNSSSNLHPLAFCCDGSDFPECADRNRASSLRCKQNIDFSRSAFSRLRYNQVLLV